MRVYGNSGEEALEALMIKDWEPDFLQLLVLGL